MRNIIEFVKERKLLSYSIWAVFTATLLYLAYFIVKNLDVVAIFLGNAAGSIISALTPFIIGVVIAYMINPLVNLINVKFFKGPLQINPGKMNPKELKTAKRKRLASVLLSYILVIAVVVAIIYFFVAMVVGELVLDSLPTLSHNIGGYLVSVQESVEEWVKTLPDGLVADKIKDVVDLLLNWFTGHISASTIFDILASVGTSIAGFVIGVFASIYMIYDKDLFIRLWHRFVGLFIADTKRNRFEDTLEEINTVLSSFIKGVCIDAVIVAVLSSIALSILGLRFAVFIGMFAGIANVIPYFGPILGMIPAFFVGTFTDGPLQGAIAVLILFGVQQIDAQIIYPRVVGSNTGLHPLLVLIAVTLGGVYGGLAGMVLAVPIAGVLKIFVSRWVHRIEKKRALKKAFNKMDTPEE